MNRSFARWSVAITGFAVLGLTSQMKADRPTLDFGSFVQDELREHAEQLFGIERPLAKSALGPYDGADNLQAIQVAPGLKVSLVSSSVASAADQIALWPNDDRPTHVFVCDEETSDPSVQRVDLSKPANANATTILTGLTSCDPVRRTPWGTILVGEETSTGGVYEIFGATTITTPVIVTNRATGVTSDANRVVKRKALGQLAFEGLAILPDGTTFMADELRPGSGNPGGAVYKFVPDFPWGGGAPITVPAQSPFASGRLFGLKVGSNGDNGQGTEIGQGIWAEVLPATYADASGNIVVRSAQTALKFTGYYRPEDMDLDPIAAARGEVRACWANTGRMSNGGNSTVETSSNYGEVMCLTDVKNAAVAGFGVPTVRRFIAGNRDANYFDNIAFQPHTGRVVLLEDGEVEVVKKDGTKELRGNDLWICLPDGADADVQSDGCVRFASIRDTSAEPSGFIFLSSGEEALVHIQHRAANDALGKGNHGALVKISGFKVRRSDDLDDDHDHDRDDHHDRH